MRIVDTYIPSPTQAKAHAANKRYKLFGGAMGGGKSRWLCEEVKKLSMKYPGNRIIMARYHLNDFKNSTLKTLIECYPKELIINHNRAEHTINLVNGSEIIYMGLAEEENISKIKSMEIGCFALDEASEIPKEQFLLLQSRLRRRLPNGTNPPYSGILATNPEDCWLKDDFVLGNGGDDYIFIPSLPKDNPYLPSDYEEQLRKTYPEEWVRKFLEGSWDQLAGGDIIIPSDWVRASINREIPLVDKRVLACDVARFGDDEIVIYYGNGNRVVEGSFTMGKSTMETAGRLLAMRKKNNVSLIVVDDVNVGGGVVDRLKEMKEKVLPINGGSSAIQKDRYANLKTEIWWYARELFKSGEVSIPNDPILKRQLSSTKYTYRSNGKLMCEPKRDVKGRLGRSPDRADALILMLWGAKNMRDPAKDFMRRNDAAKFYKSGRANPYGWQYHNENNIEVSYA